MAPSATCTPPCASRQGTVEETAGIVKHVIGIESTESRSVRRTIVVRTDKHQKQLVVQGVILDIEIIDFSDI